MTRVPDGPTVFGCVTLFIAGVVLVAGIAGFAIGTDYGKTVATHDQRQKAVDAGAGVWEVDNTGKVRFRFITEEP